MKKNVKHGDATKGRIARLYSIWAKMKQRCLNPNNPRYGRCRSKGLYSKWQEYLVFKKWALANGYEDNLTIDRINNDKGYYPGNCEWITMSENISKGNSETKRKLTFRDAEDIRGSLLTQLELAKIYGVGQPRIWNIIHYKTYIKDYSLKA